MDDKIYVQLTGTLSMLLAQVDPNRREKYIVHAKVIPVIYMILKKAIYGNIQVDYYSGRTSILHLRVGVLN